MFEEKKNLKSDENSCKATLLFFVGEKWRLFNENQKNTFEQSFGRFDHN